MKKRIALRGLVMLLTAALLISSTGVYNLLAYATMDEGATSASEAYNSSTSATTENETRDSSSSVNDDSLEPTVVTEGGKLVAEEQSEFSVEPNAGTVQWVGDGSEQNPYQISSLDHFREVNAMVNGILTVDNSLHKYFVLTNDIDLSGLDNSSVQGDGAAANVNNYVMPSGDAYFITTDRANPDSTEKYINISGSEDIDNDGVFTTHKITGGAEAVNLNTSHENFGLFGYLGQNSVVSDIIFENIHINATSATPRSVALVAYRNDGVIENCQFNNISVSVGSTSAHLSDSYANDDGTVVYVGIAGIVADNRGTVKDNTLTHFDATLIGNDDYVSAVCSQNRGLIDGCYVNGMTISVGINSSYVGTFAGLNVSSSVALGIQNCKVNFTGTDTTQLHIPSLSGGDFVGGVAGKNTGYINNTAVIGSVKSTAACSVASANIYVSVGANRPNMYFGGVTGYNQGTIDSCTAFNVGAYINVSWINTEDNFGTAAMYGGIAGTTTASTANQITNCYASGKAVSKGVSDEIDEISFTGGIVGKITSTPASGCISNCYALVNCSTLKGSVQGAVVGYGGQSNMLENCHWSDEVSGCSTAFVQVDSSWNAIDVDATTGKLISGDRTIVVARGGSASVSYSSLTHSWGSGNASVSIPDGDSGFIFVNQNAYASNVGGSSVTVSGMQDNSYGGLVYTTQITLPSGIGATAAVSGLVTISQNFVLNVLVATSVGDPDTAANPFEITSPTQFSAIKNIYYGHFKLMSDVTASATWIPFLFTGTIDGNGKTIKASKQLFTEVIGARTGGLGTAFDTSEFTSDPNEDATANAAYRNAGVIKNLTVDLGDNITTAIFGTMFDATIIDTDVVVTEVIINGDNVTDAYKGNFSADRRGVLLNAVFGNSYVYGCDVNVDISILGSNSDVAAFIGYLSGTTVVDNCTAQSSVTIGATRTDGGRSVFIADITTNTGYIQNCLVTGGFYGSSFQSGRDFLIIGESVSGNTARYHNMFFTQPTISGAIQFGDQTIPSNETTRWGTLNNANRQFSIPLSGSQSFALAPEAKITNFSSFITSDFDIKITNSENSADEWVEITDISLNANGEVVISFAATSSIVDIAQQITDGTLDTHLSNYFAYLTIVHKPTQAKVFATIGFNEGMSKNADGYYHIASAADLMWVSQNQSNDDLGLLGDAFKIVNDIDMAGYDYVPLGVYDVNQYTFIPFTGVFTGETNGDGSPRYTIYNLTIDPLSDPENINPTYSPAMFACVDNQSTVSINAVSQQSFIGNFNLDGTYVAGIDSAAALVGTANGGDGIQNVKLYINNVGLYNTLIYTGINAETGVIPAGGTETGRMAGGIVADAQEASGEITNITVSGLTVESGFNGTSQQYDDSNEGIGAIVGYTSTSGSFNISNFAVEGVYISAGAVDVGAVVGHNYDGEGTLTISGTAAKRSTVAASILESDCNVGGVIGSAYGCTEISYVDVLGATDPTGNVTLADMSVTTNTNWFAGGIAGFFGTSFIAGNTAPVSTANSLISNCTVLNTAVLGNITDNEQVTAGGIAGAADCGGGGSTGGIENCTVGTSAIRAITAGGVVGTVAVSTSCLSVRSCSVSDCSISGSGTDEAFTVYTQSVGAVGVGGILGCNLFEAYSSQFPITHNSSTVAVNIEGCIVDADTKIKNTSTYYAYTGGIVGQLFNAYSAEYFSSLKYNQCYANISSSRAYNPDRLAQIDMSRASESEVYGTGGIIGHLGNDLFGENCNGLDALTMQYCVFGGEINAHSMAGGLIGAVAEPRNTYCDLLYSGIKDTLITDCAVSGTINVQDTSTTAVGSIIGHVNPVTVFQNFLNQFELEPAINNIYVSSFTNKMFKYGCEFGGCFDDTANGYVCAAETYVDVNEGDSNSTNGVGTAQFVDFTNLANGAIDTADTETGYSDGDPIERNSSDTSVYSIPSTYSFSPLLTQNIWTSFNSEIISIGYDAGQLLLTPVNIGTTGIYTPYSGTMTDGDGWSLAVNFSVGFYAESINATPLEQAEVDGEYYWIIRNKYDFVQMCNGTYTAWDNYLILTTINFVTSDFVGASATWPGGIEPLFDAVNYANFSGKLVGGSSLGGGQYSISGSAQRIIQNLVIKADPNTSVNGFIDFGLFSGTADGATIKNLRFNNLTVANTSSAEANYIGAMVGYAYGSLTIDNVTIQNANLSGANFVGGIVGGTACDGMVTISNSAFVGTKAGNEYSSQISAKQKAAGIIADCGDPANGGSTLMQDVRVAGTKILQSRPFVSPYTSVEQQASEEAFTSGAAGLCLNLTGEASSVSATTNNIVEDCHIEGEIASGAVGYASFASGGAVVISDIDIKNSYIKAAVAPAIVYNVGYSYYFGGGAGAAGILQRATHEMDITVANCTTDSQTTITAAQCVGGIVGITAPYGYLANLNMTLNITGCQNMATLTATATDSSASSDQQGVGAIIGVIDPYVELVNIHILQCVAGGTLVSDYRMGGFIGTIKTLDSYVGGNQDLSTATGHFIENSVVSADFLLHTTDTPAFGDSGYSSYYIGLLVGEVYGNLSQGSAVSPLPAVDYAGKEPFYNIYYSSKNYSDVANGIGILLFGDDSNGNGLNTTDYIDTADSVNVLGSKVYDLETRNDFYSTPGDRRLSWTNSRGVAKYTVEISGDNACSAAGQQIKGIGVSGIDTFVNSPYFGPYLSFGINSGATSFNFVLSSDTTDMLFDIENISVPAGDSSKVTLEKQTVEGATVFVLKSTVPNIITELIFEYTNGIKMSISAKISTPIEHYWFKEEGGIRSYLIWSAKEVGVLSLDGCSTANYKLMYNLYMALDAELAAAANAAIDNNGDPLTLSDVLAPSEIQALAGYQCNNPEYNRTLPPSPTNSQYVDFDYYFNISGDAERSDLPLSRVLEIDTFAAEDLNDGDKTNLYYDVDPFQGTFTSALDENENAQSFKIYNYRAESVNRSAGGVDLLNAGMFNAIGAGASVSHIEFVNPDITVIASKSAPNNAGVLAGTITDAAISHITVTGGSVKSIRQVSPAGSNVGGICGSLVDTTPTTADTSATIQNCAVNGTDIIASTKAQGLDSSNIINYCIGGVAGNAVGDISDTSVTNCNIYAERGLDSDYFYISHLGGAAGTARGTVANVAVTGTDVMGATVNAVTGGYEIIPDITGRRADRAGGVVGTADVSLSVNNCSFVGNGYGGSVRTYDTAAGVVGEMCGVTDSEGLFIQSATLTVDGCTVGGSGNQFVTITVYGSSLVFTQSQRRRYDVAGGAVGYIQADAGASLTINNVDVNAYVGTYSYSNAYDTIAGGILASIPENASLDNVHITLCTVQGEVVGYRCTLVGNYRNRGASPSNAYCAGAAGGIVGKIFTYGYKSNSSTKFISQCSMAASVDLYTLILGAAGDAPIDATDPTVTSYSGKIIGELRESTGNAQNFAAKSGEDLGKYIDNVYISSYPDDTVVVGSAEFITNSGATAPEDCYFDVNRQNAYVSETVLSEEGQTTTVPRYRENYGSLHVDNYDYINNGSTYPAYSAGNYSEVAIVPYTGSGTVTGDRLFRLKDYALSLTDGTVTKDIVFAEALSLETDVPGTFTAELLDAPATGAFSQTVSGTTDDNVAVNEQYDYFAGAVSISVSAECVGYLVAEYSYGLKASTIFISQDIVGTGTELDPFQITKIKQLSVIRALSNMHYVQCNDLDFAETDVFGNNEFNVYREGQLYEGGFQPLCTAEVPFTGTYDGDGYTISNLYIYQPQSDNVGFFGVVDGSANISNLHIELLENGGFESDRAGGIIGQTNVGGLIGWVKGANVNVTNCSVAYGDVIGRMRVGGLVGYSQSTQNYQSCFAATDVHSYLNSLNVDVMLKSVGGLIGNIGASCTIFGCFTTGYVDSPYGVGVAGGLVGAIVSGTTVNINDCYVGATVSAQGGSVSGTTSNVGLTVGMSGGSVSFHRVVVAATRAVANNCTLAGVSNVVVRGLLGSGRQVSSSNNYYDSDALFTLAADASLTAKKTAELANGTNPGYLTDGMWTLSAGLYPRLRLAIVDSERLEDKYFDAFSEIASIPLTVDAVSETSENNASYDGIFYPVKLVRRCGDQIYNYTSSVIDASDTVAYPATLDTTFYGNGNNKNVDLLFENTGINDVTVYRNIFGNSSATIKNDGTFYPNGMSSYSYTLPRVYASSTFAISDDEVITVSRSFVLPLENRTANNSGYYYPISTARQLNALSNASENVIGTKFYNHYNNKLNNYLLVRDLDLKDIPFEPIVGYLGLFDGNNHKIQNLSIHKTGEDATEVGMFRTIYVGDIVDLVLENVSISGQNSVGALIGAIMPQDGRSSAATTAVTIRNCHVKITDSDSSVTGSGYYVGGLVGSALRSAALEENEYGIYESSSAVTVNGLNVVGGLVGYSEERIVNCFATGKVNASFTEDLSQRSVTPWEAGGRATSKTTTSDRSRYNIGAGGLVGVIIADASSQNYESAVLSSSFASGEVIVLTAANLSTSTALNIGAGGLAGVVGLNTATTACFSNGNVNYCHNIAGANHMAIGASVTSTIGVGGLIGVSYSLSSLYSCSSVAAQFGNLSGSSAMVGIGGVVGVARGSINNIYSSGSTLSQTGTIADGFKYGSGGVVGVFNAPGGTCASAYFDMTISTTEGRSVGIAPAGTVVAASCVGKTTRELITPATSSSLLGNAFGYIQGAYPYLKAFFLNSVLLDIRVNALLSIYAILPNELDRASQDGHGISMALGIPLGIEYVSSYSGSTPPDSDNLGYYAYGYDAMSTEGESNFATAIIDEATNTLSIQRTSNNEEQINIVVTIKSKNGALVAGDGRTYSSIAQRVVTRTCAKMCGTTDYPYLIASEADFAHIGQSIAPNQEGYYNDWVTPLNETTLEAEQGKVHFRLMGYVTLEAENRIISSLTGVIYGGDKLFSGIEINGIGYSVRGLKNAMFKILDLKSNIKNITFEDVNFTGENEALVCENNGKIEGVTVKGRATGSNCAAIAGTNVSVSDRVIATINACLSDMTYISNGKAQSYGGLVGTNYAVITNSAAVGNITAKGAEGVGGLVKVNNGTITGCFTMGNINLNTGTAETSNNVGGFVAENGASGEIEGCYTRCNIFANGGGVTSVVGAFVANNASGSIYGAYSAGKFSLGGVSPRTQASVFAGVNSGTLTECMFDKQLAGVSTCGIYANAERTKDIISHAPIVLWQGDEEVEAFQANENAELFYQQIKGILNTEADDDAVSRDEIELSRSSRALRAYSFISSAAVVMPAANDHNQYMDALDENTVLKLSFHATLARQIWSAAGASILNYEGTAGSGVTGWNLTVSGDATATATADITDFYGRVIEDGAKLDIFVSSNGTNTDFDGDAGTSASPYVISTPAQFIALSYYGANPQNHFIINNSIDMTLAAWNEAYIYNFAGNLNGNGKVISNVTIPQGKNNGLFGTLKPTAVIADLGVTGINVSANTDDAGLFASKAEAGSSVTGCYTIGTLTATGDISNIGGFVGNVSGATLDGCITSGKVVASGASNVGGIVGTADAATIANCLSTANVKGNTNVGGILGNVTNLNETETMVDNVIFANATYAAGDSPHNIIAAGAENANVTDYFNDTQFASVTVEDDETAKSTNYLTSVSCAELGFIDGSSNDLWGKFDGVDSYPIPNAFLDAEHAADYKTGVQLATVKVGLFSGAATGTITSFTTVSVPASINGNQAQLAFSNSDAHFAAEVNNGISIIRDIDTSDLSFNAPPVASEMTYSLASNNNAFRFYDLSIKKTLKLQYQFTGVTDTVGLTVGDNEDICVSAFTNDNNLGTLTDNMILSPDDVNNCYAFTVDSQLPCDKVASITLTTNDGSGNLIAGYSPQIIERPNGGYTVLLNGDSTAVNRIGEIIINLNVRARTRQWGILSQTLFGTQKETF